MALEKATVSRSMKLAENSSRQVEVDVFVLTTLSATSGNVAVAIDAPLRCVSTLS